jgi:hypothetical protein
MGARRKGSTPQIAAKHGSKKAFTASLEAGRWKQGMFTMLLKGHTVPCRI